MFLLRRISLPEQKMKPSESSVGSSEAGERASWFCLTEFLDFER
jgi:hypothetical protein